MSQLLVGDCILEEIGGHCDLFVMACGFESRSIYICQQLDVSPEKVFCAGFLDRQGTSFESNMKYLAGRGLSVVHTSDGEYGFLVRTAMEVAIRGKKRPRVVVDISSMNRYRIAETIEQWAVMSQEQEIELILAYAMAIPAKAPSEVPFASVGELHPGFGGWSANPEWPVTALVSVGYEEGKVLRVLKYWNHKKL